MALVYRSVCGITAALRMRSEMRDDLIASLPPLAFRPWPEESRKLDEALAPITIKPSIAEWAEYKRRPKPGSVH